MQSVLRNRFLERLTVHARGRAWLLSFLQSTEESDEGGVFDVLLSRVEDPKLQRVVKRHRDDEERHAAIFAEAVARIGVAAPPIPASLHVLADLDAALGGVTAKFIAGEASVLDVYLLLLVVEERAVREWPAIVEALERTDRKSAADVARVLEDERRHVGYARAIARQYADEDTLERELGRYRTVEATVFDAHRHTMTRVVLDYDLLEVGRFERALWRGLSTVGPKREMRSAHAALSR